jgi:signal transduction histidine kinase
LLHAGTSRNAYPITLTQSRDGSVWAGTEGKGLWRITGTAGHETTHLYTMADGLGSDSIRSLYEDTGGTLWIGTIGGGLNAYRDGKFWKLTARQGLPSDNVTNVIDDGTSLWLSTPRGIAAVPKTQLEAFLSGSLSSLQPTVYGLADGLRSAEPPMMGGGGTRNTNGSIWFATNGGIAVYQPKAPRDPELPPLTHILDLKAGDRLIDLASKVELDPTWGTPMIRYTGIHLSAPYQVQFAYKLDGLDAAWTSAGARRSVPYARLKYGTYTFRVKARLPDGAETEKSLTFSVLPRYYETIWFRLLGVSALALMVWAGYRFRVRQVQARFQSVIDERARLAREVHDTLAQGFVGISSQLAVVDSYMPPEDSPGRQSLEIARRMAQYSLTEARRSVMDLRAAALDETDLGGALQLGAHQWTARSGLDVKVNVSGDASGLPENVAHHVLRMAQEAVNNAVKHAHASTLKLDLVVQPKQLELRIQDDGSGFDPEGMLLSSQGNFGLMGMRERVERLEGEFDLHSRPGQGTELKFTVPL